MSTPNRVCFVIAPIGPARSETRRRSDLVLDQVIKPVVEVFGYRAMRADQIPDPGIITTQVVRYIAECPLVIADLTGQNANVFYELALRHSLRKPVIQMIEEGDAVPFDIREMRTIEVASGSPDGIRAAKQSLASQIRAVEDGDAIGETPVSVALGMPPNLGGLHSIANVNDVYPELYACCERALRAEKKLQVQNIGLDWKTTWPKLRYDLLDPARFPNLLYQGLIIDPDDEEIAEHCRYVISAAVARATIDDVQSYLSQHSPRLGAKAICVNVRSYARLPLMHGFCVNQRYLFVGTTTFDGNELCGGNKVYHYCEQEKGNEIVEYYLGMFRSWFSHMWEKGKAVAQTRPEADIQRAPGPQSHEQ